MVMMNAKKKYFWVYKKESFEIHLFLLIQCFKLLYIMCNWHMVTGGENLFMTNSILEVNFFSWKIPNMIYCTMNLTRTNNNKKNSIIFQATQKKASRRQIKNSRDVNNATYDNIISFRSSSKPAWIRYFVRST